VRNLTLVLALKWLLEEGEAVVMSSDSRAIFGPIAYEAKKIHPIFYSQDGKPVNLGIAGGAGDSSMLKYGYSLADTILKDRSIELGSRCLTQDEFGMAVREIESKLISRFSALRGEGIEPEFHMVLASVDPSGKASLYLFDNRGLAEPVHDDPGFAIVGKGSATGGMLLTRLLGYSPEISNQLDLGMLSAFVIDMVSEIDPEVGPFVGESLFMRIQEGKVLIGPLKAEALRDYKDRVSKRRDLIRLFNRLCDQKGEEEIRRVLEDIADRGEK